MHRRAAWPILLTAVLGLAQAGAAFAAGYQRHVIGAPLVLKVEGGVVHSEASYLVIRTRRDSMPEMLSVGRYEDRIVDTADGYRFAERLCIFDNDLIPNSLIYPI